MRIARLIDIKSRLEKMLQRVKKQVELGIVIKYGLVTTALFILLMVYYFMGVYGGAGDASTLKVEVQAYSFAALGVVILTSIAGFTFHQIKLQRRQRNGFAFVLVSGVAKLLVTLVIMNLSL